MAFRIGGIIFFCFAVLAQAETLRDEKYGFSLEIPPGFKPTSQGGKSEEGTHSFAWGEMTTTSPGWIFNVRVLGGTMPVTERLKPSEVSKKAGMKAQIQDEEIRWMGYTLD